jgi:hypothetical protein
VKNTGNIPLGGGGLHAQHRVVEIRSILPKDFGQLVSEDECEEVVQEVPTIRPRASISMQQRFYIHTTAHCHRNFPITFEMYIESPCQEIVNGMLETTLVEVQTVTIQVSNAYIPTPSAQVLLITNPNTAEKQLRAIQLFVTSHLRMKIDICNVHENGGLLDTAHTDQDQVLPITATYEGKAVIVMDNKFSYFHAGDRTTSRFWDPEWLSEAATNNNSTLFIGTEDDAAFKRVAGLSVLPLRTKLKDAIKEVPRVRVFSTGYELVTFIAQEKQFGSAQVTISAVKLKRLKWYRMGLDSAKKQAKSLAAYIRDHLPNERCLVSFDLDESISKPDEEPGSRRRYQKADPKANDGHLIVFTGLDQNRTISSTDLTMTFGATNSSNTSASQPSPFFKYTIIAALPFQLRIERLWAAKESDDFITRAMTLSVKRDIHSQIRTFATSEHRGLTMLREEKEVDFFFRTHLPYLGLLFGTREARREIPPPNTIVVIIQWALVCAASARPHRNLAQLITWKMKSCDSIHGVDIPSIRGIDVNMHTDCPEFLLEDLSTLTETPTQFFQKGELSARTVVPRTRFCLPSEWNAMVEDFNELRKAVQHDLAIAQMERDHMLLGSGAQASGVSVAGRSTAQGGKM